MSRYENYDLNQYVTALPFDSETVFQPIVPNRVFKTHRGKVGGKIPNVPSNRHSHNQIAPPNCIKRSRRPVPLKQTKLLKLLAKQALHTEDFATMSVNLDQPGVTSLTAIRALQVFSALYAPNDQLAAAIDKYTRCLDSTNNMLNRLQPRIPIILGTPNVYCSKEEQDYTVYWQIHKQHGGDILREENNHIIEGFEHDTGATLTQPFYSPHISIGSAATKQEAYRFSDRLSEVMTDYGLIALTLGKSALKNCPAMK